MSVATLAHVPSLPFVRAALLSTPMALLSGVMLLGGPGGLRRDPARTFAILATYALANTLFFLMLRTGRTDRYRAILFVAVAVCFVLTFIPNLLEMRGSMALTEEDMIRGRTPFCHMVIPMTIVPAALTRTIIFPGSILGGFADVATMLVIWLGATIALGRGFCAWGCFFGGLEDGLSRLRRRPLVKKIARRWTYLPYAVLAAIVLVSAASLSPTYCMWLWAALATPIVLATFVALPLLSRGLADGTGIRISPWFTGGEIFRTVDHEGYRTIVRRPVFDGLIGERERGFVQVEWAPAEGRVLPERLREEVDADGDGAVEFVVDIDTRANQATVEALAPTVLGLERTYDLGTEKAVRVNLRRR